MDKDIVLKTMLKRVIQAHREGREISHFALSPEVLAAVRSWATARELRIQVDPRNPQKLRLFSIPVFEYDEWSWGWSLFDKNKKPVEPKEC